MPPPKSMLQFDAMGGEDWDYISRGADAFSDEADHAHIIDTNLRREECPYCQTPLTVVEHEEEVGETDSCLWELGSCGHCAHWRFTSKYLNLGRRLAGVDWDIWVSKARTFDVALPNGPAAELAQEVRRNPSRWSDINPTRLERLVADVFRANFQPCEVLHVGKPGDGGVDVLYVDSGRQSWLIQVKGRAGAKAEPVTTIRNMLGVLVVQDVPRGIVVSTADHFTHHAYEEAMQANTRGYRLEMIDRGRLDRMLDPVLPESPWLFALNGEVEVRDAKILQQLTRVLAGHGGARDA